MTGPTLLIKIARCITLNLFLAVTLLITFDWRVSLVWNKFYKGAEWIREDERTKSTFRKAFALGIKFQQ